VFSGPGQDRCWALWAVAGYTAALLISRRRGAGQAGRAAALAAGAAGAVAGPLLWLAWRAPPTPDVRVVARSAVLLLQHGTPYLPAGQLARPNTVLFPLGLTKVKTPAASPLPGHLLATLGPAGRLAAISLLVAAGLAVAASLLLRPPADPPAAARRLAIALTVLFTLSPATRFGYFSYPIGLLGWVAIVHVSSRADPGPAW
jgi:hypothetical protein